MKKPFKEVFEKALRKVAEGETSRLEEVIAQITYEAKGFQELGDWAYNRLAMDLESPCLIFHYLFLIGILTGMEIGYQEEQDAEDLPS